MLSRGSCSLRPRSRRAASLLRNSAARARSSLPPHRSSQRFGSLSHNTKEMRRCCVSKARRSATPHLPGGVERSPRGGESTATADGRLAAELRSLKLSQLLSRATATGSLSDDQIQQAQDDEDPRAALVVLLLEAASANAGSRAEHRLREELRGLKISALRTRARAEGAADDELDDAVDTERPLEAITELIVSYAARRVDDGGQAAPNASIVEELSKRRTA